MMILLMILDYKEDAFMIPKNTSVIVRRVSSTAQRSLVIKAAPNM